MRDQGQPSVSDYVNPPPWLPHLLAVLGWHGGTVKQALDEVAKMKRRQAVLDEMLARAIDQIRLYDGIITVAKEAAELLGPNEQPLIHRNDPETVEIYNDLVQAIQAIKKAEASRETNIT